MRVAVYSKPFFPKMGGIERNTLTLCLALSDLGHEVELITETLSEEEDDYPFQVIRTSSTRHILRRLSVVDFLLTNGGNVPIKTILMANVARVPYGCIYAGFRGFENQDNRFVSRLKNNLRRLLARRASLNIFMSTEVKENTSVPEDSARLLMNPVDKWLQTFYTDDDKRGPGAPFLFAGRLIAGKGIFVLADALEHLDGEQSMELIVAGEGPDANRFQDRVQNLQTIEVTLPGRLETDELVSLYQRAKALLVPSTSHKEGNPLVIAEAVYAGTPVIVSDQRPMIEMIGDAGIVVRQGDHEELASAIRRVINDEEAYHLLRRKAKKRSKFFEYERYKEDLNNILSSVRV